MIRPSRLILGAVLVISAGCGVGNPTAPDQAPNIRAGDATASSDDTDECRSGWSNPNGRTCP